MTFKDLPEDWPDIPLTDSDHIADVLDLFVDFRARYDGAILVLVCDGGRRPIQPIQIDDVEASPPAQAWEYLPRLATTIAQAHPGSTVLFAIARSGGLSIRAADRRWRQCLEESFKPYVTVIGTHVVTPDGSRNVHDAGEAA